jgi:hypothetical protein
MAIKISFKPRDITKKLLKALPERSSDVLMRRYGLGKSVKRETLESVGRSYAITRERVRQIETGALAAIRKSDAYLDNQEVFTELVGVIKDLGSIISEDDFLNEISTSEAVQNHIHFLLVIGDAFTKLAENTGFVHRWQADAVLSDRVHEALDNVYKTVAKNELLAEREIIDKLLTEMSGVDEQYQQDGIALRWLNLSKRLSRNQLGDWGRAGSPGVNMRGIRDMAWLVLRRHGSPMHYAEVAEAIKETFNRKAHSATCHNELIKDDRFVLVGRGLYALSEWGYTTGLVKDVIKEILLKEGPMTKKELMETVKRERYVKTNTIMVNLQDCSLFGVNAEGKYYVLEEEKSL